MSQSVSALSRWPLRQGLNQSVNQPVNQPVSWYVHGMSCSWYAMFMVDELVCSWYVMFMAWYVHGVACSWYAMSCRFHGMVCSWHGCVRGKVCSWHGCVRGKACHGTLMVCVCMWSGRTFEGTDESDNVTMLDAAHDVDLELGLLDLSR